ncbi:MAG: hypothetical protein ACLRYF_04295 [Mediterraneibacter faecis]
MKIISMPRCSGKTMLVKIMRDMKRRERIQLTKWANELSDKDLEDAYYDAVYDCLGSKTEKMYDLGYDPIDIAEQEKCEKYLSEKADVLEELCERRGIKLWE